MHDGIGRCLLGNSMLTLVWNSTFFAFEAGCFHWAECSRHAVRHEHKSWLSLSNDFGKSLRPLTCPKFSDSVLWRLLFSVVPFCPGCGETAPYHRNSSPKKSPPFLCVPTLPKWDLPDAIQKCLHSEVQTSERVATLGCSTMRLSPVGLRSTDLGSATAQLWGVGTFHNSVSHLFCIWKTVVIMDPVS